MSDVVGIGGRRHFSVDEEQALRQDASTNATMQRQTGAKVDIHGTDASWRTTKEEQQMHLGWADAGELAHAFVEGSEFMGALHLGAVGAIGGAVGSLLIGAHALCEAHAKGEAQAQALERDVAHVALLGVLDLPGAYKAARLDGDYGHVEKGVHAAAFAMGERVFTNPKAVAVLQLHADRGMNAARDLTCSGMTREVFLKTHPQIADHYAKDAAFREGFDAYLFARAHLPAADVEAMDEKLRERDGWYAQSQVRVRV